MKNQNLLLKFKLAGDRRLYIKIASRIKVDGRGKLLIYDSDTDTPETVDLRQLRSLNIQPFTGRKKASSSAAG